MKENTPQLMTSEEQAAMEYVREVKGFYSHLISYLLIMLILFAINYLFYPSYIWAWWAAFGWGCGMVSHALSVFLEPDLFGANWEKKQVEKRLGRKL